MKTITVLGVTYDVSDSIYELWTTKAARFFEPSISVCESFLSIARTRGEIRISKKQESDNYNN